MDDDNPDMMRDGYGDTHGDELDREVMAINVNAVTSAQSEAASRSPRAPNGSPVAGAVEEETSEYAAPKMRNPTAAEMADATPESVDDVSNGRTKQTRKKLSVRSVTHSSESVGSGGSASSESSVARSAATSSDASPDRSPRSTPADDHKHGQEQTSALNSDQDRSRETGDGDASTGIRLGDSEATAGIMATMPTPTGGHFLLNETASDGGSGNGSRAHSASDDRRTRTQTSPSSYTEVLSPRSRSEELGDDDDNLDDKAAGEGGRRHKFLHAHEHDKTVPVPGHASGRRASASDGLVPKPPRNVYRVANKPQFNLNRGSSAVFLSQETPKLFADDADEPMPPNARRDVERGDGHDDKTDYGAMMKTMPNDPTSLPSGGVIQSLPANLKFKHRKIRVHRGDDAGDDSDTAESSDSADPNDIDVPDVTLGARQGAGADTTSTSGRGSIHNASDGSDAVAPTKGGHGTANVPIDDDVEIPKTRRLKFRLADDIEGGHPADGAMTATPSPRTRSPPPPSEHVREHARMRFLGEKAMRHDSYHFNHNSGGGTPGSAGSGTPGSGTPGPHTDDDTHDRRLTRQGTFSFLKKKSGHGGSGLRDGPGSPPLAREGSRGSMGDGSPPCDHRQKRPQFGGSSAGSALNRVRMLGSGGMRGASMGLLVVDKDSHKLKLEERRVSAAEAHGKPRVNTVPSLVAKLTHAQVQQEAWAEKRIEQQQGHHRHGLTNAFEVPVADRLMLVLALTHSIDAHDKVADMEKQAAADLTEETLQLLWGMLGDSVVQSHPMAHLLARLMMLYVEIPSIRGLMAKSENVLVALVSWVRALPPDQDTLLVPLMCTLSRLANHWLEHRESTTATPLGAPKTAKVFDIAAKIQHASAPRQHLDLLMTLDEAGLTHALINMIKSRGANKNWSMFLRELCLDLIRDMLVIKRARRTCHDKGLSLSLQDMKNIHATALKNNEISHDVTASLTKATTVMREMQYFDKMSHVPMASPTES